LPSVNNSKKHHRLNQRQSFFLVTGLTSVLAIVGWFVGGFDFTITTVVFILSLVFIAPYISPIFVLRLHKAEQLSKQDFPSIFALLDDLTLKTNLTHTPKIYYIPSRMMMAFTVGLKHNASIALTDGLLRRMNRRELNAILAHEISHIKHQDMRLMAIAGVTNQMTWVLSALGFLFVSINNPLSLFATLTMPWAVLVLFILLPLMTTLMKMKLSRTREFAADHAAAKITQDPAALISALSRLEYREWRWLTQFFWQPQQPKEPSQLRTHPDTDERIERLKLQSDNVSQMRQTLTALGLDRIMPRHVWELNKRLLSKKENSKRNGI